MINSVIRVVYGIYFETPNQTLSSMIFFNILFSKLKVFTEYIQIHCAWWSEKSGEISDAPNFTLNSMIWVACWIFSDTPCHTLSATISVVHRIISSTPNYTPYVMIWVVYWKLHWIATSDWKFCNFRLTSTKSNIQKVTSSFADIADKLWRSNSIRTNWKTQWLQYWWE